MQDGTVKEYYGPGKVKREIVYQGGKASDAFKEYFEDGKVKVESRRERGTRNTIIVFHENGVLKSETIIELESNEGRRRTFDDTGKLLSTESIKNGQVVNSETSE